MNRRFALGVPAVVALAMLLGGCLVTSSSNQKIEGNYVPQSAFDQIEAGKTSAAWIKATLGEPSEKTSVDGGDTTICKYHYVERTDSSGSIFLIFGGSSTKQQPHTAYVEMKDGVVVKKWRS